MSRIIMRIDRTPLAHRAEGPVNPLMTELAAVNQTGKRYRCETCGTEVICVKAGQGRVACHGQPMDVLAPKRLPSTD
jgi:desulfoferrodoxin-like iron-binding protein